MATVGAGGGVSTTTSWPSTEQPRSWPCVIAATNSSNAPAEWRRCFASETNREKGRPMLKLLTGAAIGAAAVWFLDPERGGDRRTASVTLAADVK